MTLPVQCKSAIISLFCTVKWATQVIRVAYTIADDAVLQHVETKCGHIAHADLQCVERTIPYCVLHCPRCEIQGSGGTHIVGWCVKGSFSPPYGDLHYTRIVGSPRHSGVLNKCRGTLRFVYLCIGGKV